MDGSAGKGWERSEEGGKLNAKYIHLTIPSQSEPQVFLAFSFKDKEFAEELARMLRERGIRTWLATHEIKAGEDWQLKVKENLQTSDYLLAIISKSSAESYWTQWEFQMAIEIEKKNKKPRVIPILIEDVTIPPYFNDKQCLDFHHDYKNNLGEIITIIRKIIIEMLRIYNFV